jgi:CHAT domain-containing protein
VLLSNGRYFAWVVTGDRRVVRLDLGEASAIEESARAFTEASSAKTWDEAAWRAAGNRLRSLFWEPVAAKLPASLKTVYVSPDAALAAVPLAALPGKEPGRVLLDDVSVVMLSTAQDLVPRARRDATREGALLVGDVDFAKADAEARPEGPARAPVALATDRFPAGRAFLPLPATAAEVASIRARTGPATVTLVGAHATEARFRAEVRGRRLVHLATHGFVRDDLMRGLDRPRDAKAVLDSATERHFAVGHDPLLLSGVALAGSAAQDGGHGDDGVLTALEASLLDLEACDLVVLSACDTARGTPEAGEGVLGLVRALEVAGARRVVGSLWKVGDDATRLWMERFYDGLLRKENPLSPAQALREASLWLRDRKDADGARRHAAPWHWAAFVCYGG